MQYGEFASIYDALMADAPHDGWLNWFQQEAPSLGLVSLERFLVADVGCGTGSFTVRMAHQCREILGVDQSESMLAEAAMRATNSKLRISFLCQDMRDLRLPRAPQVIVSTCDCLNYLLDEVSLRRAIDAMASNLDEQGWLCFDVLGPLRIEQLRDGLWFDIDDEQVALFETNVTDTGRVTYELHAFSKDSPSNLYRRIEEIHEQQFFNPAIVSRCLDEAGFEVKACLGDFGRTEVSSADRVAFVAQKR